MLVRRRREGQGEMSTRGGCQVRSVGGVSFFRSIPPPAFQNLSPTPGGRVG
jgi:hypothetical protein